MAVHQTRAYFLNKFGHIVDEPRVGKELADVYWVRLRHAAATLHVLVWQAALVAPSRPATVPLNKACPPHRPPATARPSWTW